MRQRRRDEVLVWVQAGEGGRTRVYVVGRRWRFWRCKM